MEKRVKQGSIRTRFTQSILLILSISYVLTLAVLLSFVRSYFYTNFYNTAQSQVAFSADYYRDNLSNSGSLIETLYADQDSWWRTNQARVQIYDTEARLILDSQASLDPESTLTDIKMALSGHSEYQIFKIQATGEHVMSISEPLISTNNVVGVLRHIVSLEQVDQNLRNIVVLFFFIGGVISAAAALLGIYLSRRLVKPITELTDTAREMARGNYNVKSPVMSHDEIGTLSRTFNYMASEIAKKDELKNDFISSISHELRTPLTAIKGWAITLKDPTTDKELMDAGLGIIETEADRLKNMVDELLDFSKFTSGKIELNLRLIDPLDLDFYLKSLLEERIKREDRDFQLIAPETLEPFRGDEDRIKQVLINLIDNAFKFTATGDRILVEFSQSENSTFFIVSDTGSGIAREEIPKVTEKFFKGKHAKSSSGIGLSIVNEIVLLHNGRLDIESELGKGTKMTVIIPREEA